MTRNHRTTYPRTSPLRFIAFEGFNIIEARAAGWQRNASRVKRQRAKAARILPSTSLEMRVRKRLHHPDRIFQFVLANKNGTNPCVRERLQRASALSAHEITRKKAKPLPCLYCTPYPTLFPLYESCFPPGNFRGRRDRLRIFECTALHACGFLAKKRKILTQAANVAHAPF